MRIESSPSRPTRRAAERKLSRGASVSTKHANFIVTVPGATAADVRALIELVRSGVSRASGIVLQTEVRTIGGPDV